MGTIKQYSSQANVPASAGTAFAPNSLAQQSFAGADALNVMGDVATGMGQVKKELERRNREFLDTKNSIYASTQFDKTRLTIDAFKEQNPNPETWNKKATEDFRNNRREIEKLDLSPEAKQLVLARYDGNASSYIEQTNIQRIQRNAQDAEDAASTAYLSAVTSQDPTAITEASALFDNTYKNTRTTEQAKQIKAKLESDGIKIFKTEQTKTATDALNFGAERAKMSGDSKKLEQIYSFAFNAEVIDQEQYKTLVDAIPMDMVITSAKRIAITDPNEAQKMVDSWNTDTMNDKQLSAREGVLRDIDLARKQKQVDSNIIGNSIIKEMTIASRNHMPPKEKQALAERLIDKILDPNSGMTTEQTAARIANVNSWAMGKDNTDDWSVYDNLSEQAKDVYLGSKSRDDYETEVNKQYSEGKLTRESQQKLIEKMDNPLTPQQTNIIRAKSADAKEVIVGTMSNWFTTDESGKMVLNTAMLTDDQLENAKLKLWYVQQYEEDITKWMLTHDGNTGREFEQYTEGQKMRYWQTSLDDIKAKKKAKLSQMMATTNNTNWQPNANDLRPDGSQKGTGFLGVLQRPDGKSSSEITVGVNIGGKEMDIPSMVPSLTKDEVQYLLNTELNPKMWSTPQGKAIMQKAVDHAKKRIAENKSVFADNSESPLTQPTYKIGDIVIKGGKNLKVVGFDTDGTPLVDEVK